MKRTAAFFYSETPKDGFTPVPIEGGRTGYVRGALCPPRTTLIGVLDWAHTGLPGATKRYPEDECFMNGHYVSSRKIGGPKCPNCGSPIKGHGYDTGCVLGALIGVLDDRGTTTAAQRQSIWAKVDADKLWPVLGSVVDELENGEFS